MVTVSVWASARADPAVVVVESSEATAPWNSVVVVSSPTVVVVPASSAAVSSLSPPQAARKAAAASDPAPARKWRREKPKVPGSMGPSASVWRYRTGPLSSLIWFSPLAFVRIPSGRTGPGSEGRPSGAPQLMVHLLPSDPGRAVRASLPVVW